MCKISDFKTFQKTFSCSSMGARKPGAAQAIKLKQEKFQVHIPKKMFKVKDLNKIDM